MKKLSGPLLSVLWLALMCLVAWKYFASAVGPEGDPEIGMLFTGLLLIMNFPIGFLALFLASEALEILVRMPLLQETRLLAFWLLSLVLGYAQWFVLLPRLVKTLRRESQNLSKS